MRGTNMYRSTCCCTSAHARVRATGMERRLYLPVRDPATMIQMQLRRGRHTCMSLNIAAATSSAVTGAASLNTFPIVSE
jgi:hypothetical protein